MRISVIMPVNLGYYELIEGGQAVIISAPESEAKFKRAVNSFINQSFKDAELIIISDGCVKAEMIYLNHYTHIPSIHFKRIDKQAFFGGIVRQTGIEMATGEIICYLDHDDMFGQEHLAIINKNFNTKKYEWIYYDDYVIADREIILREVQPIICMIGTSSIAHRKNLEIKWGDGYGHDWDLVRTYLMPRIGCKIPTPQYYVCHRSNVLGVRGDGVIDF